MYLSIRVGVIKSEQYFKLHKKWCLLVPHYAQHVSHGVFTFQFNNFYIDILKNYSTLLKTNCLVTCVSCVVC